MVTIKVTIVDWIRFLLTLPLSPTQAHLAIMSCVTSDLFLIVVPFSSKSGQNMIHGQSHSGFHQRWVRAEQTPALLIPCIGAEAALGCNSRCTDWKSARGVGKYGRLPWPGRIPPCPAAKQPSCRSKRSSAVCGLSLALSCRLSISVIEGICCLAKYILNFLFLVLFFTSWMLNGAGIMKCCPVSAPEPLLSLRQAQCATAQQNPPA